MAQATDQTREGTVQFELGNGEIAETWFRITGDLVGLPSVSSHQGAPSQTEASP